MKFLVTDIKFDFNSDLDPIYSVSEEDQELITREHLGAWDADDEDDLIEEVTANAVSYTHLTLPTIPTV